MTVRFIPGYQQILEGEVADYMSARVENDAEQTAKGNAPVRTGRLRSSIQSETDRDGTLHVFSDVEYAPYVEYGTGDTPAQPYLRPTLISVARRHFKYGL